MKKLLLLSLVSMAMVIPQIYSISVAEYIKQHGVPSVMYYGSLDLPQKNITDLEGLQNIPEEVRNQIKSLNLSHNQIQTLPMGIFSSLNNLQELYLNSNQLKTLPSNIFNGLNNLQQLVLNNNQLKTLPVGVFNGLNNLRELYLNDNQIQTLPVGIFNGLTNLQLIDLVSNQLQTLPVGIFNGLNNLRRLHLSWNQIQTLPPTIFNGLTNLQELSMGYNQLKTLPVGIFNGLSNLDWLFLRGNPFNGEFLLTLPAIIKGIPNLQKLDYDTIDKALKSYRVYQPKSLLEASAGIVAKNLSLEEMAKLPSDILDKMPLTSSQRTKIDKLKKQINQ